MTNLDRQAREAIEGQDIPESPPQSSDPVGVELLDEMIEFGLDDDILFFPSEIPFR